MPDIEFLMQAWPSEFEQLLKTVHHQLHRIVSDHDANNDAYDGMMVIIDATP